MSFREKQKRNLLATLLFSQGVPLIVSGDEMGRTQRGNNNAYCQDNELSWLDWDLASEDRQLLQFVSELVRLRNAHPLFRRRTWFRGRSGQDPASKDIAWLHPGGEEMTDEQWDDPAARALGVFIPGRGAGERDERGRPVEDDDVLLLLNAHDDAVGFALPHGVGWELVVDTSSAAVQARAIGDRDASYPLQGRTLALLLRPSRSAQARTGG
jgi:glycogen operon protein